VEADEDVTDVEGDTAAVDSDGDDDGDAAAAAGDDDDDGGGGGGGGGDGGGGSSETVETVVEILSCIYLPQRTVTSSPTSTTALKSTYLLSRHTA